MPYAGRVHLLAALLLLAAPATAQSAAADARTLALAAGWKASFLCSDIFVGGMDEKSVISNELEDAQTNLQPLLAGLEAKIDRAARRVEVSAGPDAPARVAQYVQGRGCVQLPIGGKAGQVPMPAELIGGPDRKAMDARPWPQGDSMATASLPAARKKALEAVMADGLTGDRFGKGSRTSALLVVQDGKIVAERYARGVGVHTPQRTFSVAKSLSSALIGRAAALGASIARLIGGALAGVCIVVASAPSAAFASGVLGMIAIAAPPSAGAP